MKPAVFTPCPSMCETITNAICWSFCGVLKTQRRFASTGSTMRADAAIEIIGVSVSATTSIIASEFGVIVEPTITSTLSSVISLRVFFTADVVSDASSRTMYWTFLPPIVCGISANVLRSGMPSDAAGPVADTVTPTLMSCASTALAPTAARRVANSLVVNFMSLLFFFRWNGGRRKVNRANAVGKRMRTKSDPFNKQGNALPDADAHRGERVAAAGGGELARGGQRDPRPRSAERMPQRDRAAVRVHVGGIVRQAEAAGDRQSLRGEGFVQFDHVDVRDLQSVPREQLLGGGRRPDAHDPRRHAGRRRATDAGDRLESMLRHRGRARDQRRDRAVVDARGVARGHRAVRLHDRLELRQRLQRRLARMLVLGHDRVALAARHGHRRDLAREEAARPRREVALLRTQRERVLVGARDAEFGSHVLGGF